MPWSARFEDPIPLPRGRQLVTLQDSGLHHEAAENRAHGRGKFEDLATAFGRSFVWDL
jgi:hypothetical protein